MADIPICGALPIAWLAGFIKGATRHYFSQNIKSYGLLDFREEDLFMFFILKVYGG